MTLIPSVFSGARCCLALCLLLSMPLHAEPVVLASIKPLALIAEAVTGERARVDTLLPASASPHDYPLRVSDVRRLQAADLVLWVGPELESFLQRPLRSIAATRQLQAQALPGISWPRAASHAPAGDQGHRHDHERDPHLWLNPLNAVVVARALAVRLGELDPEGAAIFQSNAEQFAVSMESLDQRLMGELESLRGQGFAVYHEGYGHFVERYGLRQLAHVTFTPERRPGARHMHQLRQQLRGSAACLFAEPYYDMRLAEGLARELDLRLGVLDPLGSEMETSYQELLEGLAQAFSSCLSEERRLP